MNVHAASGDVTVLSTTERQHNLREGGQEYQHDIAGHLGELQPVSCEYVGPDTVLVSLRTGTGETVSFSLKTAALVQSINQAVALINNFTSKVFKDLDVF
jgi:hypothetical protein